MYKKYSRSYNKKYKYSKYSSTYITKVVVQVALCVTLFIYLKGKVTVLPGRSSEEVPRPNRSNNFLIAIANPPPTLFAFNVV